MIDELDFIDAPSFELRDYQIDCINAIREGWKDFSRALVCLPTGSGKTIVFSQVIKEEIAKGNRVLVLAHTDELIEQAIDKLDRSTGVQAEKEKADSYASSEAFAVVGSIQTLARTDRLVGFEPGHFSLVIVDECHRTLAASYLKVLNYFHYGEASLDEEWQLPADRTYEPKARILGVTATADRGDRRSLGEFYQKCVYEYGLLAAVRDGYLVRPLVKNIPLKIDLKKSHPKERTSIGGDYSVDFIENRMAPFIDQLSLEISKEAFQRKTVVFTPSISTAMMVAEALRVHGIRASFVSGACTNRSEKIKDFETAEPGCAIVCAMLLAEGWDCATADTVCMLRPTKIRSLLVQCLGRATRTLPGTIDGLKTREERLAAIAASKKPHMLVIDFFWTPDKMDIIRPIDLATDNLKVKEAAEKSGNPDIFAAAEVAERDFMKSVKKVIKENSKKKPRIIDPLAWAVSLGDETLSAYTPENPFDEFPAQKAQLDYIAKYGFDVSKPICRGLANKIMERISSRETYNLCTPKQMNFLLKMGFREQDVVMMPKIEANKKIAQLVLHKRR